MEPWERRALSVIVVGTLMVAVDTTIVLLALPTMAAQLHASLALVIWTILAYLLLSAVLTIHLGRVGDVYGRARMYILGFVVFTVGSFACSLAPDIYSLIAFRSIQAVGGAFMVANSIAIVSDIFPARTRGVAFGYTTFGYTMGATLGIVLGGIITTLIGWRYIFLLNVPIGLVAIPLGLSTLKDPERRPARIDYPGMALLGGGLALVTYGATEVALSPDPTIEAALLAAGLALVAVFFVRERTNPNATIPLAQFRDRLLGYSLAASFFQSLGYLAITFLVIMYLQGVRGLDPLSAALLLVPGYILASSLAPFMGRISDRIGPRTPATVGILGMLAAVLLYASVAFTATSPLLLIVGISVIGGVGSALFYPANNSAIMASARRDSYGSVSGLARSLGNMGTLLSFVLVIAVATVAVPRGLAFAVFLGTTHLIGGIAVPFLYGLRVALLVSAGMLGAAAVLSYLRGAGGTTPPAAPR